LADLRVGKTEGAIGMSTLTCEVRNKACLKWIVEHESELCVQFTGSQHAAKNAKSIGTRSQSFLPSVLVSLLESGQLRPSDEVEGSATKRFRSAKRSKSSRGGGGGGGGGKKRSRHEAVEDEEEEEE